MHRRREFISDTGYCLNEETFLFGILAPHIDDEYVIFKIEDFEELRKKIHSRSGWPCYTNFEDPDLEEWLEAQKGITKVAPKTYKADMEYFMEMPTGYLKEAKEMCLDDRTIKIFHLLNKLRLDINIALRDTWQYKGLRDALCGTLYFPTDEEIADRQRKAALNNNCISQDDKGEVRSRKP